MKVDSRIYGSVFRVFHGVGLLLFLLFYWRNAKEWLTDDGFNFPAHPLLVCTQEQLIPLAILQLTSLIFFILGWRIRWMSLLTGFLLIFVTQLDRATSSSINLIYIFSFFSIGAFPVLNGNIGRDAISVLRYGVVAIYFGSGLNKVIYGSWLDSFSTLKMVLNGVYTTDLCRVFINISPDWFLFAIQIFIVIFEVFSPVLFFHKKTKIVALLCGLSLHTAIALFMYPFVFLSMLMISFYILFLSEGDALNKRGSCDSESGYDSEI